MELMRNFLYFPGPNSLFKKSCICVVSLLVNNSNTTLLLSKRKFQGSLFAESFVPETRLFKYTEKLVLNMLKEHLSLPKSVKWSITSFIHPMVRQVFDFIQLFYILDENTAERLSFKFVFTDRGVLDKQKSVEAMIKLNNLKSEFCFMLASVFGLETILHQSDDNEPITIAHKSSYHYSSCIERYVKYIAALTSNSSVVELSPLQIHEVYGIINDACVIKFNISMKNAHERERFAQCMLRIIFDFGSKVNNEGIRYLLSCVSPQVAIDIVHENAFCYLITLLDWKCLDLFVPSINNLWSHLTNTQYLCLTEEIIIRSQNFDFSQDYKVIFFQFWEESPEFFKEYLYLKCTSGSFLSRILVLEQVDDIFEKIMESTSSHVRQKMIFHFEGMNICDTLVRKGNLGLLEKFVRYCVPDKTVLSAFLNQYLEYKPYYFKNGMASRKLKFKELATHWLSEAHTEVSKVGGPKSADNQA